MADGNSKPLFIVAWSKRPVWFAFTNFFFALGSAMPQELLGLSKDFIAVPQKPEGPWKDLLQKDLVNGFMIFVFLSSAALFIIFLLTWLTRLESGQTVGSKTSAGKVSQAGAKENSLKRGSKKFFIFFMVFTGGYLGYKFGYAITGHQEIGSYLGIFGGIAVYVLMTNRGGGWKTVVERIFSRFLLRILYGLIISLSFLPGGLIIVATLLRPSDGEGFFIFMGFGIPILLGFYALQWVKKRFSGLTIKEFLAGSFVGGIGFGGFGGGSSGGGGASGNF